MTQNTQVNEIGDTHEPMFFTVVDKQRQLLLDYYLEPKKGKVNWFWHFQLTERLFLTCIAVSFIYKETFTQKLIGVH